MNVLEAEIVPEPREELTLEQFRLMWGEKSGFDELEMSIIWQDAQTWYSDLPYHNFDHALDVLWESMRLADSCEDNDIQVDRRALIVGALFHDAGYHLNHEEQTVNAVDDTEGFSSKEAFSAAIVGMYAGRYGLTSAELFTTQNAIIATTRGSSTHSLEDKILRRADLANVAGRYAEDFLQKTRLLHEETELLCNQKINVWKFATTGITILSEYVDDDLSLGDFDNYRDRQTVFQFRAIENLKKLSTEIAQHNGEQLVELLKTLGTSALNLIGRQKD